MNEDFHHFTKYQEDSAFEDAVHTAFQNLLVSNEMAYNPYPQLVQHFRRYIERWDWFMKLLSESPVAFILTYTVLPIRI